MRKTATSAIGENSNFSRNSDTDHQNHHKRHRFLTMMGRFTTLLCLLGLVPLVSALIPKPPGMRADARFFLDTADTAEWDALLPLGIFHGVTTNPITLDNAGHPCDIFEIHDLAMRALDQTSEFICHTWGRYVREETLIAARALQLVCMF